MQGSKALCQFIFSRQNLLQNIRHMEPVIYLCFGNQSSPIYNTSATRVLHERHECNTSEKSKPSKGFQSTNGKILYHFCFIACKQFCVICIVSETTVLIFQEKFTYEDVKQEGS